MKSAQILELEADVEADDWKREMDKMLEVFEQQAVKSLRNINQNFELLGRSFNEEFRKYFLQISSDRLSTAYSMVLMEIWDKTQVNSTRPYTEYLDRTYYRNSDFAGSSTNVRKSIERQIKVEKSIDLCLSDGDAPPNHTTNFGTIFGDSTPSWLFPAPDQCSNGVQSVNNVPVRAEKRKRHAVFDASIQRLAPESKKATITNNQQSRVFISTNATANDRALNKDFPGSSHSDNEYVKVERKDSDDDRILSDVEDRSSRIEKPIREMNKTEADLPWFPIQMNENNENSNENEPQKSERQQILAKLRRGTGSRLIRKAKRPIHCLHCDYSCFLKTTLHKHLTIHPDGIFPCTKCSQKFTTKDQLDKHIVVHNNRCAKCRRKFKTEQQCISHESRCKYRTYECWFCHYECKGVYRLKDHMQIHTGDKRHTCKYCPEKYSSIRSLGLHKSRIHNIIEL